MNDLVDKNIYKKKSVLLDYYRSRAEEIIAESKKVFADSEYKKRASYVNKGLTEAKENLIKIIDQKSKKENWSSHELLQGTLLITYTNYIVMMEARNDVWPYEYMTFSRRIGELWEPFCQLCWAYPIKQNINFFVPPLFKEVKEILTTEIEEFIDQLKITSDQKKELKKYYHKVWTLVTSGEIKLELDLHFEQENSKYVIDFKSGFSSNEKGNTNRLLLVASIYNILNDDFKCLIFVRSSEERNNHYLQTLKRSGLWEVLCGKETYDKIREFTGFDFNAWMKINIDWEKDFDKKMYQHLSRNNLVQYLEW